MGELGLESAQELKPENARNLKMFKEGFIVVAGAEPFEAIDQSGDVNGVPVVCEVFLVLQVLTDLFHGIDFDLKAEEALPVLNEDVDARPADGGIFRVNFQCGQVEEWLRDFAGKNKAEQCGEGPAAVAFKEMNEQVAGVFFKG